MASNIPAALKSVDVGRFAVRAAQLEKAKPIIAYWCELTPQPFRGRTPANQIVSCATGNFYIVNQIIERGLHTSDDEVKLYTTDLMEKLEQVRQDREYGLTWVAGRQGADKFTALKFQNQNRDNDAISDSMAASAYVEEFGLEVFGRAEAAMRADKVTKSVRAYLINLDLGLILQQTNSRYIPGSRDVPRIMPGLEPPRG